MATLLSVKQTNGSKLAISSDHMNYKVGKTDVPKKKDDSVLNQLVAKRVEGSEDTVEFPYSR